MLVLKRIQYSLNGSVPRFPNSDFVPLDGDSRIVGAGRSTGLQPHRDARRLPLIQTF